MATTEQLEKKTKNLTNRIKRIIDNAGDSPTEKAIASDLIMDELRKEYIYVRYAYFKRFFSSTKVTIDPYSDDVILELGTGDHEVSKGEEKPNDDDYVKIPAYSFGPFDAKAYFESNERFLWLIKEPFCKNHKELIDQLYITDPNLFAYDQSAKYNDEFKRSGTINKTGTIGKLLARTQKILNIIDSQQHSEKETMNNTCILELNYFPGLAFHNTTDSDNPTINKWVIEINHGIILTLIDFYNPSVIMCGGTLNFFIREDYNEIRLKILSQNLEILGKKIYEMRYMTDQAHHVYKNVCYLDECGRIVVEANHPSRDANFTKIHIIGTALFILELKQFNKSITQTTKTLKKHLCSKETGEITI